MSTSAVVMMIVALVLVWGGLAASVVFAVRHSRARRSVPGRDT